MGLYDNHNHCQFSFDGGRTSVEATARSAASKGLAGLCFTDHCDLYLPDIKAKYEDVRPETFDVDARNLEIDRVANLLRKAGIEIEIFKGIEIGMERHARKEIADMLTGHYFDHVIASVHYLDDTDPYWGEYFIGKSWKEAYGRYLEAIYEEMTWLGDRFDIMGHYDYVTRYAPYPECSIMLKDFSDILEAMLKFLAENGKALEINTKTYQSYKGRTPVCDTAILKRFRELGGEMISLGSDSHDAESVGFNFEIMSEFVKSCGFSHITHFAGRKPIFTKI